jgi:hypothetical protein
MSDIWLILTWGGEVTPTSDPDGLVNGSYENGRHADGGDGP